MKTRYIAAMAAVALALCCFAAFAAEDDAAFTPPVSPTYQPTDAVMGSNHMKVIVYDDGALLVDTNSMTNLGDSVHFTVGLTPYNDATPSTEVFIGPVSMQNGRVWIDATGANAVPLDFLQNGKELDVKLYAYLGSQLDTATLTFTTTVAPVHIYQNFNDTTGDAKYSPDEVNNGYTGNDFGGAWARLVTKNLTTEDSTPVISAHPNNPLYSFKGLSQTSAGSSVIVVEPNSSITVEDLIFEMFDSGISNPITSNQIALYAIWEKTTYQMLVADVSAATPSASTNDDAAYKNTDVQLMISSSAKAKANLTEMVAADDFGLIRIEQTVPGNYTYTLGNFQKITATTSAGVNTWGTATLNTDYEVVMIVNGVYKIIPHADIRFTVQVADTDKSTQNGYAFAIDSIKNDIVEDGVIDGNVQLSLDLFDYKAGVSPQESISLKGTYFRTLGASSPNAVRVYGNIDTLAIADAAVKGVDSNTWTAKIDNVAVTPSALTLNDGALKLTADQQVYDLILDLYTYNIYAAQGVWTNYEGTGSATTLYTPWALYQQ